MRRRRGEESNRPSDRLRRLSRAGVQWVTPERDAPTLAELEKGRRRRPFSLCDDLRRRVGVRAAEDVRVAEGRSAILLRRRFRGGRAALE